MVKGKPYITRSACKCDRCEKCRHVGMSYRRLKYSAEHIEWVSYNVCGRCEAKEIFGSYKWRVVRFINAMRRFIKSLYCVRNELHGMNMRTRILVIKSWWKAAMYWR